jgi:hypothetical protein
MLEYFHYTLVVWWSISIKLWWYDGVFTPTYQQSLMEILQHIQKRLMEILQHTNKV